MMTMTWRIYFGYLFLLFLLIALIIHQDYTDSKKCEDAGGVYGGHGMCVNPTAVIEVN